MAFLGQEEQIREYQERFKYLYAIVAIALSILLVRLIDLQVLRGDRMRQFSEENRIKRVKIVAPRGMIFDRNRTLLIDNHPAFDLEIIPQYLRESKQTPQVIAMLAQLLQLSKEDIMEALDKARNTQAAFLPVKIKADLTRDEVATIESWKISMPGVQVSEEIKRTNVYGEVATHLLGYIGEVSPTELPKINQTSVKYKKGDLIGKFGLEKQMEEVLRGIDGEKLVEVDAVGRTKLEKGRARVVEGFSEIPPKPGKNLVLTIDQDLQLAAVKAFGEKIGSVVAIDPRNGEILAMVSRPSFDPSLFSRGIPAGIWSKLLSNENKPLLDKSIQEHYMPGSVFKVVTAIAGLEEGVIDENTKFHCSGNIRMGNRLYHCHSKHGHGEVNVVRAITQSCDIFFYRLAQKLKSVDDIANWSVHLGLGKKTGIPLAREVPGLIPTEEWKRAKLNQPWHPGETLPVAIGQSYVLTTTIQLANLYASIANGGTLYRPHLVKTIETNEQVVLKEFKAEPLDQTRLKPKTYDLVTQGLWGVVNSPIGTAFSQRLQGMDFVGKTGTAQVIRLSADKIYQRCENMKFKHRHNALFAGYAPANNPVIAVAVIAEHACHGSSGAAPIARSIIKTYLEKYYPELYNEKAIAARLKGQSLPTAPTQSGEEEDFVPNVDDVLEPAILGPVMVDPLDFEDSGATNGGR